MSVRVRVVGVFAAEVCRSPAHGCAGLLARLLRSCTWKGQVRLLGLLVALRPRRHGLGDRRVARMKIVGHLFRNKSRTESNDELLIFITPRVIKI